MYNAIYSGKPIILDRVGGSRGATPRDIQYSLLTMYKNFQKISAKYIIVHNIHITYTLHIQYNLSIIL